MTISIFVLFVDSNSLVYMYVINRFCVTWLNVSAKQINLLYCCTQRKSNRSHYTGLVHEMYIYTTFLGEGWGLIAESKNKILVR